jgi:ParB/RepB/Spo0J family partition protein
MTTTHDAPTSAPTTADAPQGYALRAVDPRTLLDNPHNARRPHRDREGLAPSIGALGILNPPLVRQLEDGRLELVAGERRKYSAIKAGPSTIPVFVRNDLSPIHQLAGMLVENHGREGLTASEEAVAIAQLAGFEGTTLRDITTMTGTKAGTVRSALKVAASDVATAIGERHGLSLDQLMVLAEFDTDADAVKSLTVTALKDSSRFDHLVAQLRRSRDDRVAYEKVASQITDSGVALVELQNGWWLPDGAVWLSELFDSEGTRILTPAKHRKCPGHAGAVQEADDGYEAAYLFSASTPRVWATYPRERAALPAPKPLPTGPG